MAEPFIVKVQWPLTSSEPNPQVLIYNEYKSLFRFVPQSEALRKMMDGRPKVYYWATLSDEEYEGDHFVVLGDEAPNQN